MLAWWVWVIIAVAVVFLLVMFSSPMRRYRKISKM